MNKLLPLKTPDFSESDPSQLALDENNSDAIYIHPESEVGLALAEGIADIEAGRVTIVTNHSEFISQIFSEALAEHKAGLKNG
ncbi:MAG: hypothetical protein ORN98_10325 [Alphaproteobacteria bacterium]|nr:hypothetical protein [Alphaproteobacteria bacterium]